MGGGSGGALGGRCPPLSPRCPPPAIVTDVFQGSMRIFTKKLPHPDLVGLGASGGCWGAVGSSGGSWGTMGAAGSKKGVSRCRGGVLGSDGGGGGCLGVVEEVFGFHGAPGPGE